MGWWRAAKYTHHRIVRLSDTSHKIAGGLAIGAAISFSPLVGTHFIQAGAIAYLFRMNIMASFVGTFVGNPWTFPFIWWGSIKFGGYLFTVLGLPAAESLPETINWSVVWDMITNEPLRVFLPWMLGGYILATLVTFPAYLFYYNFVKAAKLARSKARLRRLHKIAMEVTGQKE